MHSHWWCKLWQGRKYNQNLCTCYTQMQRWWSLDFFFLFLLWNDILFSFNYMQMFLFEYVTCTWVQEPMETRCMWYHLCWSFNNNCLWVSLNPLIWDWNLDPLIRQHKLLIPEPSFQPREIRFLVFGFVFIYSQVIEMWSVVLFLVMGINWDLVPRYSESLERQKILKL